MAFFTKLGETISATGKDVSQKAKELTELARMNLDVKAKEDFIEKQYMEIGKQYFELHKEDEEPLFEEIKLISESLMEIERLKSEMAELKGKKKCPACGAVVEQDAIFCNQCGAKCESIFEEETVTSVNENEEMDEEAAKEETIDFTGQEIHKEEE